MDATEYLIVAFDEHGKYSEMGQQVSTGTPETAIAAWTKTHKVLCSPDGRDPATVYPLHKLTPAGLRIVSLFAVKSHKGD